MRLRDVVERYLNHTKRVLDISQSDIAIESFLYERRPTGITKIDYSALTEAAQPNDLIVDAVARRSSESGFLSHLQAVLRGMPTDTLAIFLLRDVPAAESLGEINWMAGSLGCQLLEVVRLSYPAWPAAVVVARDGTPPAGQSSPGRPAVMVLRRSGGPANGGASGVGLADPADPLLEPDHAYRYQRLAAQVSDRDRRVTLLEAQIEQLEDQLSTLRSSTSLRVGTALVGVARRPSSAARLPARMIELWRHAKRGGERAPRSRTGVGTGGAPERLQINEDARFLAGLTAPPDRTASLQIFGVVTDSAAATLSDYASLVRLLPHEARPALELGTPDLVMIQARALLAPGAWAHAATPGGAVSYSQALHDLVLVARQRGVPVVVWCDIPRSVVPALSPVTRRADLVLSGGDGPATSLRWSAGVSLMRFYPTDKGVTDKVLLYDADARLSPSLTRMRSDLESAGLATVRTARSPDVSDLIRQYAVAVASPFSARPHGSIGGFTLAALATGSRVLCGQHDSLLAAFPSAVLATSDPAGCVAAARTLLAMPRLTPAEYRTNLRWLFDREATPVSLARLATELGLKQNPLADRQIAVLAQASDIDELSRTVDSLLSQSVRPARLVIAADSLPDRALDEAAALGISTTVVPFDQPFSAMAALAESPWAAIWDSAGGHTSPHLLKDLAVAAECSRADAVGVLEESSGDAEYGRYADSLPLRRSLVRRELLVRLEPSRDLRVLVQRGARLFGVAGAGGAQ